MNPRAVVSVDGPTCRKRSGPAPSCLARRLHSIFQQTAVAGLSKVSAVNKDGVLNFTVANRALQEPDGNGTSFGKGCQTGQQSGMEIPCPADRL